MTSTWYHAGYGGPVGPRVIVAGSLVVARVRLADRSSAFLHGFDEVVPVAGTALAALGPSMPRGPTFSPPFPPRGRADLTNL